MKHADEEMYEHWWVMEYREQEWSKAADAAEKGLKIMPDSKLLFYLSGKARTRLGKEFSSALQSEKAVREFEDAKHKLKKALNLPSDLYGKNVNLNCDIYRALVLVCEVIGDLHGVQHYFNKWQQEFPDDPDAASELERISRKFPTLNLP